MLVQRYTMHTRYVMTFPGGWLHMNTHCDDSLLVTHLTPSPPKLRHSLLYWICNLQEVLPMTNLSPCCTLIFLHIKARAYRGVEADL